MTLAVAMDSVTAAGARRFSSSSSRGRILAEALDVLTLCEFDQSAAASRLGCTGSQLTKLLKDERSAFQRLNDERVARGMPRLK